MARRHRSRAGQEGERKALHLLPWRQVCNLFPPIDPGIVDGLNDYIARRKEEIYVPAA